MFLDGAVKDKREENPDFDDELDGAAEATPLGGAAAHPQSGPDEETQRFGANGVKAMEEDDDDDFD